MRSQLFVFSIFFVSLFLVPNVLGDYIYQEDANAIACSGSWIPFQPCSKVYDGDWDTYGESDSGGTCYVYLNYTKPDGALNSSYWQTKDFGNGVVNHTVTSACWDYSPDKLMFRASSIYDIYWVSWDCYDGSWHTLGFNSSAFPNLYEEGMFWNISEESDEGTVGSSFPMLWILPIVLVFVSIFSMIGYAVRSKITLQDIFKLFILIAFVVVFTMAITSML